MNGGGDADASVSEEFLDYDELDALFQDQRGGGCGRGCGGALPGAAGCGDVRGSAGMAWAGRCVVRNSGVLVGKVARPPELVREGCVGCWRFHWPGRGPSSEGREVRPCRAQCAERVRTIAATGDRWQRPGTRALPRWGRGVPERTLQATLRGISSLRTACSRADLSTEWMWGRGSDGSSNGNTQGFPRITTDTSGAGRVEASPQGS